MFNTAIDFDPERTRFLFDLDLRANAGLLGRQHRREMARWLKEHRDAYVVLYHGTGGDCGIQDSILHRGLLPTTMTRRRSLQSASGFVYLTYDPRRARTFAEMGNPQDGRLVVWAAVVPLRKLLPDLDQLRNKRHFGDDPTIGSSLIDSLSLGGGARIKGSIPSNQLVLQAETTRGREDWRVLNHVGVPAPTDFPWRCVEGWREQDMDQEMEAIGPRP